MRRKTVVAAPARVPSGHQAEAWRRPKVARSTVRPPSSVPSNSVSEPPTWSFVLCDSWEGGCSMQCFSIIADHRIVFSNALLKSAGHSLGTAAPSDQYASSISWQKHKYRREASSLLHEGRARVLGCFKGT